MNDEATEQETLDTLLDLHGQVLQQGLYTCAPAVVVSYQRSAGTVEVSFPVGRMVPDGGGNWVPEAEPNMKDVPIAWPRSAAFGLTFPLAAGDTGMVMFCMRNIGPWRTAGQAGSPGDTGMHTMDGAVFYPGLAPDTKPPTHADASNMVVGSETDGAGRIEILPAGGHLGAGASKGINRAGDKTTADTTMAAWIAAVSALLNAAAGPVLSAPGTVTPPTDFGVTPSGSPDWKVT